MLLRGGHRGLLPAPAGARPPLLPPPRLAAPPLRRPAAPPRRRAAAPPPPRAVFDNLSRSLSKAWDAVRKDGRLTADNIKAPLRDIRRALLEADVSLPVVRRFVARVEAAALGESVLRGVTPDQQLVRVVYDELKALMGGEAAALETPAGGDPQVVLMAGLQGTGKTTAAGKLAALLKRKGAKVLLVACDVYRPAAVDQLVALGGRAGVEVFHMGTAEAPAAIAAAGVAKARAGGYDAVIVDTAGRTQVDEGMMQELRDVAAATAPTDTLLVVDAMTGQEAAALVKAFDAAAPLTGAVLTKLDGDSRGGAALSVYEVSGRPIKFVGTGEKLDALEPFYPDRMAQRILGMGDVLTLVEKAEAAIAEDEAAALTRRMVENKFDFNDFLTQYRLVSGMGSMAQVMRLLPGMAAVTDKQFEKVERQVKLYEAMIGSMTPAERASPELLAKSPSRRRRVARGSGRKEADVAELVAVFTAMRGQMAGMGRMMALSGGRPGGMTDEEMMAAVMGGVGPRPVAPGRVRRKKRAAGGSRGAAALAELAAAE